MFNSKKETLKPIAKVGAWVTAAAVSAYASVASADILTDSQTALADAGADALTVGGYVVAAIAGMIVVGMVISMIRKAG